MIRAARFLAILPALLSAGCQTGTTTHYGISGTRGHRERAEAMLQRFARRENLQRFAEENPPRLAGHRPFVRYRDPLLPGLTLTAYDLADSIETELSEHRITLGRPSGQFSELEQRLRNEFHDAFGSELRFRTEAR